MGRSRPGSIDSATRRQRFQAAAAMRFIRVPWLATVGADTVLGDLRYDREKDLGFAEVTLRNPPVLPATGAGLAAAAGRPAAIAFCPRTFYVGERCSDRARRAQYPTTMRLSVRPLLPQLAWHVLAILILLCLPVLQWKAPWWELPRRELLATAVLIAGYQPPRWR